MSTIQCPVCNQTLEGEFQMSDRVKCPACETAFIPGKLAFADRNAVRNDASSPVRPKEIGWAVTVWMSAYVARHILFSLVVINSILSGDMALFEALIGPLLFATVTLPIVLLVAWKLFKGKNWARIVYNVCAPIGVLQNTINAFGMKALSTTSTYDSPLPDWLQTMNVFWAIVVVAVTGCILWWINQKQSICWFTTAKAKKPDRPWWILIIGIIALCDLIVFLFGLAFNTSVQRRTVPARNISRNDDTTSSRSQKTIASTNPSRLEIQKNQVPAGTRRVEHVGDLEVALRWCPPGQFLMGSPDSEDERDSDETQHSVTLTEGFWMGETEVSQLLWEEVMDGNNPSKFPKKDDTTAKSDDYPVDSVSWNDCQEFLKEINRKYPVNGFEWCLPTEAQWEYACRAGSSTPFFWGDSLKGGDKANCCGEFPYGTKTKGYYRESTVPVHRFVPNAWDLYNMYGNVLEWCLDWYGTYPNGDTVNPTGQPSGFARVLRGGAWGSRAHRCRSACRTRSEPDTRYSTFGLRVTLVPVQSNITRDSF